MAGLVRPAGPKPLRRGEGPAIHVFQDAPMAGGYVYILASAQNGILYVGVTSDLVRRICEHRNGLAPGFTKRFGVKRLVYFEQYEDIQTTIQRENNIKHWSRAWKVGFILAGNPEWNDLYDTIV
jgi:putative endonuclease